MPKRAIPTLSSTYIALLRGINVGGHAKVPMAKLKNMFENIGFTNTKTLLNTGNVVFGVPRSQKFALASLTKTIETQLEKTFKFPVRTILRTREDIESLIASQPFKSVKITPQTLLYVTFLAEKPAPTSLSLKIPYTSPDGNFRILKRTDTEIFHVLTRTPDMESTDVMKILEKEFGKNITTRNWNTIVKMAT